MIVGKFGFPSKIFAAASGFFSLIKAVREGSRIECDKTNSGKGRGDQLDAGLRMADAEI
jgi:hypothetical protein